ncbi:PadR family transcriptional regulator [Paenibacillus mucilaginosus]|uniref:Transcriptional regulator, PadR-like family n=1 Tax=Paenibacillus mucilaginosus (strain KNP414) TaxID=1036673 RepID=F8F9W8_PAEMK|nr:PadR family transcriptional regulator [Paenibacillus mucilaginosus]AEI45166.1 transcriptional regulator, PadR-like family [Paenibacillus mucilaginosus KNP414]MCG7212940.1 PadR family transcriptional regulator [Paenibacillus mucilaginosus]WDM26647.1 helix-turn-helix transcriptional regulator [Paenibacillus mucilaginosus]
MSMKLVILGLLMEGDSHPYEMRQKMKERAMLNYIKMQEGSLYYAIDTLHKSGHVEAAEIVSEAGRPDRTVYRITEAGRELFRELLLEQFEDPKAVFHPMYAALMFARHGDQERIAGILEAKTEEQRSIVRHLQEIYEEHIPEVSRGVLHIMKGRLEHAETELRWMKRLLADCRAGRLGERGTPLE